MQYVSFNQEQERIAQEKAAAAQMEAVMVVTAECRDLTRVVNQTTVFMADFESEIQTFSTNAANVSDLGDIKTAASQYITAVNQVETNLSGLEGDLQAVPLSTETLTQFRDSYVEVVQGFGTALNEAGDAMQLVATVDAASQLPERIEQSQQNTLAAVAKIEGLSQQESSLISDVNVFCEEANIQKVESQLGS
ncbi:MAG: hypothetical protein EA368_16645 [Leptolyngbya sp. DLM2.Bin27]|nr:MAG: hypothetical protein EA368_16645 [Leptolyngbya sp. DLM2.Bin27]